MPLSKKFRPRIVPLKVFHKFIRGQEAKVSRRLTRGQKALLTQKMIKNAIKHYKAGLIRSGAHNPGWRMPEEITPQSIMDALQRKTSNITCKIFVTSAKQKKYILRVGKKTGNEGYVYNIPLGF